MSTRASQVFVLGLLALMAASCADQDTVGPTEVWESGPQLPLTSDLVDCDPLTAFEPCPEDTDAPTINGYGLPSWVTWTNCTTDLTADADTDGFNDHCEFEVARAFRPALKFTRTNTQAHYEGRRSFWTARIHPTDSKTLEVFYLLAFFHDNGTFPGGATSHKGDSEFIILRITNTSGSRWQLSHAVMSAHWKTATDATTSTGYSSLQYVDSHRGRPYVYSALWKHANYPSQAKCKLGGMGTDVCGPPTGTYAVDEVEVLAHRNIGQKTSGTKVLIDCAQYNGHQECFFTDDRFYGWESKSGASAPGYRYSLASFGFISYGPGDPEPPCDNEDPDLIVPC